MSKHFLLLVRNLYARRHTPDAIIKQKGNGTRPEK